MAQIVYRGNLSAKVFPFISEWFGRSVIVQGQDQNFNRQVASSEDLDKDRGIPQIYYCHNVMPSAAGFQSIGFDSKVVGTGSNFQENQTLRDTAGNQVFFSNNTDGTNWVLPYGATTWQQINTIPGTVGATVTTAAINGQSYVFFANVGCYMYQASSNTLIPIIFSGLDVTTIIGITSANGYMIAYSTTAIAWSSTVPHLVPTDPIDFTPSLTTGAGGGNIEAAKGKIVFCLTHFLGFIIYTTTNAISAVYSGNANYPYNFREIVNSGGLASSSLVGYDPNTGNHFTYTTSGMQMVSVNQTQTMFPEITDFITCGYFEDFDEVNQVFNTQVLTTPLVKKLTVISDRYLIMSYGVTNLTHCLVFDTVQKRYGKLKINHVDCFEYHPNTTSAADTPRNSIGFLQSNGSIQVVNFKYAGSNSSGVMILGKYQYVRSRTLQLEGMEIDSIKQGNNLIVNCLTSIDGTNTINKGSYLTASNGNYRKYSFHSVGINHSILFIGNFYLDSFVLTFNIHGRR